MKSVRVVVHGRVQGVFFRDTVARVAGEVGVAGWVRNCSDGTVEARFEGSEAGVEQMVELCRRGPKAATVDRVEKQDVEAEGLSDFVQR